MKRYQAAVLDADFAIKVGMVENINIIGELLPQFSERLYVHRHVFDNEILFPPRIKQQIGGLLEAGCVILVDRQYVEQLRGPAAALLYDAIVQVLRTADPATKQLGKNWGEVVSLAFAKVMNVPIFLSDDGGAQRLVDEHLNLGEDAAAPGNIRVVRIQDFICWMKEKGFRRGEGKVVWRVANKPLTTFDSFWPPSSSPKP